MLFIYFSFLFNFKKLKYFIKKRKICVTIYKHNIDNNNNNNEDYIENESSNIK